MPNSGKQLVAFGSDTNQNNNRGRGKEPGQEVCKNEQSIKLSLCNRPGKKQNHNNNKKTALHSCQNTADISLITAAIVTN